MQLILVNLSQQGGIIGTASHQLVVLLVGGNKWILLPTEHNVIEFVTIATLVMQRFW